MKESIQKHTPQSNRIFTQFNDEFVRSLLEAVHTTETVLLLRTDSFPNRRLQQIKNCSIISSISRNTAHITCYPLQENSLSPIVSDLPTNRRAYMQRLTDSKTLLFVFFTQFTVWMIFYLSDYVIQPSSWHITTSWLTDWLTDRDARR